MKMETDLSKLARWLIPGWVAILTFYVFVAVDIIFTENKYYAISPSINEFVKTMYSIETAIAALLVAAAGVPIGFLIYQMYFFFRWNSPFSPNGFLFSLSQGRMNELKSSIREMDEEELSQDGNPWRSYLMDNPLYSRDHAFRWSYLEALFIEAAQKIDTKYPAVSVYTRHRYLHEVLHTLGASIFATYFGFIGYFSLKFSKINTSMVTKGDIAFTLFLYLAGFVFLLVTVFSLLNKEENAKTKIDMEYYSAIKKGEKVQPTAKEDKKGVIPTYTFMLGKGPQIAIFSPGMLFMLLFSMIHLFGNPLFSISSSPWEIVGRISIAAFGGVVWMTTGKKVTPEVRRGDAIAIGIILLVGVTARIFPGYYLHSIHWAYLTNLLVFLVFTIVLTKNRQNTKDEMSMLEYYTMRRFLTDKDNLTKLSTDYHENSRPILT